MMKKILVSAFLALFGLAMANVTLANNDQVMCTQQYQPVCGEVQVQCVRAPCFPVQKTFGNSCEANAAHATNIKEGTCDTQIKRLQGTSWELTTFNGSGAEGTSTLSFATGTFSAKVCNNKGGSYTVDGNMIHTSGMMSTLMFCEGKLGEYENAFNLDGARYELATDGGNHMRIETSNGAVFEWKSLTNNGQGKPPVLNTSWKRYGLIIWQLNQIAKLRGFDTVAQKQTMAQGLLDKMHQIMIVSIMTPRQNTKRTYLLTAIEYYRDHIGDGTFNNL